MTNEIRAAVAARLAGVEGVGRVYDHVLVGDVESRKGDLTDAAGALHVWMVEPGATLTTRQEGASRTDAAFRLHAYWEVREGGANEQAFADLADAVRAAFAEPLIADGLIDSGPCDVAEVDHSEWASVLCHYRQFRVVVTVQGNL